MTLVGLEYLKQQETKRANQAQEALKRVNDQRTWRESVRHNIATESEAKRHNVRGEDIDMYELSRKTDRDTWEHQLNVAKQELADRQAKAKALQDAGAKWTGAAVAGQVTDDKALDWAKQLDAFNNGVSTWSGLLNAISGSANYAVGKQGK